MAGKFKLHRLCKQGVDFQPSPYRNVMILLSHHGLIQIPGVKVRKEWGRYDYFVYQLWFS